MSERASPTPYRVRFHVLLSLIPAVTGVVVTAVLWGDDAHPEFFSAAAEVLVVGAVGMALTGRFFRLATHRAAGGAAGYSSIVSVLTLLVFTGLGLISCFEALARGHPDSNDVAFTAGALAAGIAAFGIQALFGTPGEEDEPAPAGETS